MSTNIGFPSLNVFDRKIYKNDYGMKDYQLDFLERIVPVARNVQQQTYLKARDLNPPIESPCGIFASLVIGFAIATSKWGSHPVVQPKVESGGKKYNGNNLCCIVADQAYLRVQKGVPINDKVFKGYASENAFAVDLADMFTYKGDFQCELGAKSLSEQINIFAVRDANPTIFVERIAGYIKHYAFDSFDVHR